MSEKFRIRVQDEYGWESHKVTGLQFKVHISRIWMEGGELHFSLPAGCCAWWQVDEQSGIFTVGTREDFDSRRNPA